MDLRGPGSPAGGGLGLTHIEKGSAVIWVLAFTIMIGQTQRHITVEPFSTFRACEAAAARVAMIPKADPATCKLKEQRPA